MAIEDKGKILIEIVLDDGSVQKGFARVIDESKKAGKESTKNLSTIGDVLNADVGAELIGTLKNIPIVAGGAVIAIAAIGFAFKEAFDLAKEGEQLIATEKQFNSFATAAGLDAVHLKEEFEKAAGGMIAIDDVTKIATKGIINLGAEAAKLPELLDLSRKITKSIGGDAADRFEGLSFAIEAANQKALKANGIILDVQKALKDYAIQIGTTARELNQAQKSAALLNAVLEVGGNKFSNAAQNAKPIATNMTLITVALKETREEFAKFVNSNLGDFFVSLTTKVANFFKTMNQLNEESKASGLHKTMLDAAGLRAEMLGLEAALAKAKEQAGGNFGNSLVLGAGQAANNVKELEAKLADLQARLNATGVTFSAVGKGIQEEQKKTTESVINSETQLTKEQLLAIQDRHDQILALNSQAVGADIQRRQAEADNITNLELKRTADEQIFNERLVSLENEKNLALSQAAVKYTAENGFNAEQRGAAELAITSKFNSQIQAESAKHQAAIRKSQILTVETAKSIIGPGLTSVFSDVGARLQSGQGLFDNFGAGVVGIIGDLLINIGGALIVQGLAIEAFVDAINSLLPGSGLLAAAAGVGLVLFGSALKASVGKGGGSAPDAASGSTSNFTAPDSTTDPTTSLTPVADRVERRADTSVVINIQGDVLDSDESGGRIVDLINGAFDKKGVQVRRGLVGV